VYLKIEKNAKSQVRCLQKISKQWALQDTSISFWRSSILCCNIVKQYVRWWSYQLT